MRFGTCVRPLDALLGSLRDCLDRFPDKRRGLNTTYPMGDIGMVAFSVFFMQSPSFPAHQRQFEAGHGHSNCTSLFGIAKIPSDNHIRDMLDAAAPVLLHPVFAEAADQIRHIDGGLEVFRRLDGRVLVALDGTEYHGSRKIPCQHCSARLRGKGEIEYYHSMLAATAWFNFCRFWVTWACETTGLRGPDFDGKTSCSRGDKPARKTGVRRRLKPLWVGAVAAEAVPGPAASANADGFGRSSLRAGFCPDAPHNGCA
jgi:hypothetical protein